MIIDRNQMLEIRIFIRCLDIGLSLISRHNDLNATRTQWIR